MTPLQAILQLIIVAICIAAVVILMVTNHMTSTTGTPIITGLIGSLTTPIVTQSGKLGNNAPK